MSLEIGEFNIRNMNKNLWIYLYLKGNYTLDIKEDFQTIMLLSLASQRQRWLSIKVQFYVGEGLKKAVIYCLKEDFLLV